MGNPLAITKRKDLPTTLCNILNSINPVLNPSTDTILCVFVNHASSKWNCWKVIECSEMYENLCWVDYEEWQAIFPWIDAYSILNTKGRLLTNLRNSCLSVIKIVLDSMLYETLKWPQSALFYISSKKNSGGRQTQTH